jgi:hypothetical protein
MAAAGAITRQTYPDLLAAILGESFYRTDGKSTLVSRVEGNLCHPGHMPGPRESRWLPKAKTLQIADGQEVLNKIRRAWEAATNPVTS